MTQQLVTPYTFYIGDGVQTTFTFAWVIAASSELEVYLAGVLTTAYTRSGQNIIFYQAPPLGQILFLRRVTPQTQLTDYVSNDPFGAAAHEEALDKLTRQVQDLLERLSRMPALLVTTPNALRNLVFPASSPSHVIGWNATGTGLTVFDAAITQVQIDPVSGMAHGKTTQLLTASDNATALVAGSLCPAGTKILGVTYRCLIDFSTVHGLSSVDLGGMGLRNGWGDALGIVASTVSGEGHITRDDEPRIIDAEDVILWPNGGNFGPTGACNVTCHWRTLRADL